MKLTNLLLISLFAGATLLLCAQTPRGADPLPASRRARWDLAGVPGGIPVRTNRIDVTKAPFYADKTGVQDASAAITAAIAASTNGQAIFLPAGTYLVRSNILGTLPSFRTLVGAGMSNTVVNYDYDYGNLLRIGSEANYTWSDTVAITCGLTAGTSNLVVAAGGGLATNQLVKISELNSTNPAVPVISVAGFERMRTQMTRVTAVNGNAITIWPPLAWDLSANLKPQVHKSTAQGEYSGIEDMTINAVGSDSTGGILYLSQCFRCWLSGVKVTKAENYAFSVADSLQCEIRGCWMQKSQSEGSNHAGLLVASTCSMLVEDNILAEMFPLLEQNAGSCGNVYGYNFFHDSTSFGGCGVGLDSNHNPHNSLNLYEGNVVAVFQSDGYFGSCSQDVLVRNWVHGIQPGVAGSCAAVVFNRFSREAVMFGNVVGATNFPVTYDLTSWGNPNMGNAVYSGTASPLGAAGCSTNVVDWWADFGRAPGAGGFQELDLDARCTALLKGNFYFFSRSIPPAEALGGATIPASYYRTAKPVWFGAYAWPPIEAATFIPTDPLKPAFAHIPAQGRFFSIGNTPVSPCALSFGVRVSLWGSLVLVLVLLGVICWQGLRQVDLLAELESVRSESNPTDPT